jgi:hypothetical protein
VNAGAIVCNARDHGLDDQPALAALVDAVGNVCAADALARVICARGHHDRRAAPEVRHPLAFDGSDPPVAFIRRRRVHRAPAIAAAWVEGSATARKPALALAGGPRRRIRRVRRQGHLLGLLAAAVAGFTLTRATNGAFADWLAALGSVAIPVAAIALAFSGVSRRRRG